MTAALPAEGKDGLTSFGFLQDADQHQESPFALNAILNRVKSALGASTSLTEATAGSSSNGDAAATTSALDPASRPSVTAAPRPRHVSGGATTARKASMTPSGWALSTLDEVSEAPQSNRFSPSGRTGNADLARNASGSGSNPQVPGHNGTVSPSRTQALDPPLPTSQPVSNSGATLEAAAGSMRPPSLIASSSSNTRHSGGTSRASTSTRALPLPLRTIALASTMAFPSSAHAVAHRITTSGHASSSVDDHDSVTADDGDPLDGGASRDQLGNLRNRPIDHSHWAAHGWSAIPGFPLSKDILADDARSVHSTSSRFPRSDTIEDAATTHYGAVPGRTGFQTSADVIIRRMRGEGLSRKFWMADENAKECRECLTVFTPFRRKHHCRVCGQIFCGRCASHIIKGHRFGYDGLIRVCNFCMRMLEDYDHHGTSLQHQHPQQHNQLHQHNQHASSVGGGSSWAQESRALRGPHPALRDKQLISAPLEAQTQSPQAQFAANNLFASASAAPAAAFAVGSHRLLYAGSAFDPRSSIEGFSGLDPGPPSSEAFTKQPPARQDSAATTAAPFRKGLADDEMAVAPPAEEAESNYVGHLMSPPDRAKASSGGGGGAGASSNKAIEPRSEAAGSAKTAQDCIAFPAPRNPGLGADEGSRGQGLPSPTTMPTLPTMPSMSSMQHIADVPRLRLISDAASRRPSYRTRLHSRPGMALEPVQAEDAAKAKSDAKAGANCSPVLGGVGGGDRSEGGSVDGTATTVSSSDAGREREQRLCMLNITPALLASSISVFALHHLKTMMEQTLVRQRVPRPKAWLDVLLPIILTAVSKVKPNPRESSSMDVRDFIKIKRIPGGKAAECEYVHGFVCSKNVATKSMAKSLPLTNARIMVVKFPLDYHRGPNQFMSLEPLMAQEHEFIRILVARVVALRPQIVVVEKTVSRLAIELLERAGVVVVWSFKPSAIEAISRCTQADIITSIDRLALDPRLGRCHSFSVETFEHSSFPEMRKSFMRFEGTPKDLGCTIVLRGANGEMLSRIKRILELMIFVAYNLRLEEHVMQDEGAAMDTIYLPATGSHSSSLVQRGRFLNACDLQAETAATSIEALEAEHGVRGDAEGQSILAATQQINRVLKLYSDTLVSSSACIRLPPPFPIARLKEENDLLLQLKRRREAEELERILKDEGKLQKVANGPTPAAPIAATATASVADTIAIADDEEGELTPTAAVAASSADTKLPAAGDKDASANPGGTADALYDQRANDADNDATAELRVDAVETPKASTMVKDAADAAFGLALHVVQPLELVPGLPSDVVSESAPATPGPAALSRPNLRAVSVSELPTRTTSPAPASLLSSSASVSSRSTLVPSTLMGRGASGAGAGGLSFNSDLFASLRSPSDVAKEFEYDIVKERHAAMLRRWARYLDVPADGHSPFDHQKLCMLTNTMCAVTQKPCEDPRLVTVDFYGESDETLGHHLEELARNSSRSCPLKGCNRANVLHYRSYVHNRVRIQVVLERFVCPIPGEENRLLSWSYCKVCENATPVAIVTPESWSFSFAKYLELYFYRHDSCKTKLCDHDFYRDQVRYFAYQNLAIRFHSEEVELYEVAVPSTRLYISPEKQSNLKNEESVTFSRKNSAYWDSVMARIKALSADACSDASGPNKERNRLLLSERIKKCEADRREVESVIVRTYRDSAPTDVLCLNRVQRALQEKVVRWDLDFIEFEKSLIPTEKDIRRITTNHLKRLFAEKDVSEKGSEVGSVGGGPLPTATEIDESAAEAASESANEKASSKPQPRMSAATTTTTSENAISTDSTGAAKGVTDERSASGSTTQGQVTRAVDGETPAEVVYSGAAGVTGADEESVVAAGSSSSATSPLDHPRLVRPPKADDGGDTTDATDLSPSESRASRAAGRCLPRTTPMTAPASSTFSTSQPRGIDFYSTNVSRADESSCTESELARSVSNLVRRFDGPRRPAPMHANSSGAPASRMGGEVRRPGMRRGKTEEALSSQVRSGKGGVGASQGPARASVHAASGTITATAAEEAGSRATSPLRRGNSGGQASSQSRVPRIKRGDSATSVTSAGKRSGTVTPTGPSAPPSSFRPPKGEGLKAGPRPIVGRTGASIAAARHRGSDSDRPGHASGRQDASGSELARARDPAYFGGGGSRVPVPRRGDNGPGTRSRVSTIAKHFDRISREAERERERQHRLLVAQLAKRARPVAMTRAKVEVFSSIKEAVRDDESDRDTAESGDDGASAADNEDEGDDDFVGDDPDHDVTTDRERGFSSASSSFNRRGASKGLGGRNSATVTSTDALSKSRSSTSVPGTEGLPTNCTEAATAHRDTLGGTTAPLSTPDRESRRDASQSTIRAPMAGSPDLDSTSAGASIYDGGGRNFTPDNAVARRQLGRMTMVGAATAVGAGATGSELGSDAQSVTASSITGSTVSSTLPSYLRNGGMFADSDSTISLERSFLKTLSGFWAFRTGEMVPLEYPMLNSEHVFGDSAIIFREDEPSSIIAFTLGSTQYNDRLRTLQTEGTRIKVDKEEAFMPGVESAAESEGWGMIDVEGAALESVLKKEGTHFRCEFESGSTRLWCKILFAEQFDALRRSCSCEHSFVESLSRCLKWDSSGGKSGSAFLKTRDDRLVVKQLSRFEMDAFSKFAPQYFCYMSQCFGKGRRSTLAKIFGCFRIGFRNPQTGKSLKMDCLVMENLFYEREVTKIYDLKGSMRNRHIQETGKANEVLLDENLVEMAYQSPLFVREHSKRLLRSALYNDSLFLADMNVMDYSLVVGVDRKQQELVVGIIDFVRTFTWDKRVESFVKETALLGGAGKGEPTIITPRQYRTRFLTFLDKSFLLTPDFWIGEGWVQ